MSVTIIFGLGSATFLTFVVVPVVYSLVNTKLEEKPIDIKSKFDKINFKALKFWKK
jgi:Cu/Ag efflux pump CusA